MSKYHPLDVRHPSNRNRERNNYLLDPPDASAYDLRAVQAQVQAPSRRSKDYGSATDTPNETAPAAKKRNAAAPWGRPAPATTPPRDPPARAHRSWLPRLALFGIIAYAILDNYGLWEKITLFVSRIAYDLGF